MILRFRKINKDIFDAIKSGKKKIETRAATSKFLNIKKGDILTFSCDGKTFDKKVKKVALFKSIPAMLKKYKPTQINPKAKFQEDLIKIYYSFPGYKEKIAKYGLIALELE